MMCTRLAWVAVVVLAAACKERPSRPLRAVDAEPVVHKDPPSRAVWQVRLAATPGSTVSDNLFGPVVLRGGQVIVGSNELAGVNALDPTTGELLWRVSGNPDHFAVVGERLFQVFRCDDDVCLRPIDPTTGKKKSAVVVSDFVPGRRMRIAGATDSSLFLTSDGVVVETHLSGNLRGRLARPPTKEVGPAEARLVVRDGEHTWLLWRDGRGHRFADSMEFRSFDEPLLLGGSMATEGSLAVVMRDGVLFGPGWTAERFAYVPGALAAAGDGRVWAVRYRAGKFFRAVIDMQTGKELARADELDGSLVLAVHFDAQGAMLAVVRLLGRPRREQVVAVDANGKQRWTTMLPAAQERLRTDPVSVIQTPEAGYVFFDGRSVMKLPPD